MNKKLNILFLCGWYPSRVLANNGDFIQRHAEAVSLLHNVSVLHIISDKNCIENIEIVSEKNNGIATHIAYVKPSKNPVLKAIRFYKAYKKILQKIDDFDIIHLNELFPFGMFTFLQKKPFIVSEHWTGYHQPQAENIGFWQRFLSKKIAKKARFMCPVSEDLQNSMQKIGLQGNYVIVPNVVDTKLFFSSKKVKNTVFTILHISNMNDAHKNVTGIIKAVSQLNFEYQLILIGENSSQYKSVSDSLQIANNIEFIEHLPHKEIPKYLQQADVFVLFSNYENLPCVILESFACGTPVISTDVGGVSEFFPKEFGYLISKSNTLQLTKKLTATYKKTIKNSEKMHAYAVQHFSKKSIATQFTKLYKKSFV